MRFLATFLALASIIHAAAPEELRYRAEVLAEGMPQPIEFQIAPDGRIFWIELAGKVRLLDPKTGHITEVGTLDVWNNQESGLIGMALDPQFARNHWMYLLHSPKDFEGQHLSRFTIKDDQLDLASESILLKYAEQRRECCHHAGCHWKSGANHGRACHCIHCRHCPTWILLRWVVAQWPHRPGDCRRCFRCRSRVGHFLVGPLPVVHRLPVPHS